jgi:hypothetical protein
MPALPRFSFPEQEEILPPGLNLHAVLPPVPAVIFPSLTAQPLNSLQHGYAGNLDRQYRSSRRSGIVSEPPSALGQPSAGDYGGRRGFRNVSG